MANVGGTPFPADSRLIVGGMKINKGWKRQKKEKDLRAKAFKCDLFLMINILHFHTICLYKVCNEGRSMNKGSDGAWVGTAVTRTYAINPHMQTMSSRATAVLCIFISKRFGIRASTACSISLRERGCSAGRSLIHLFLLPWQLCL